MELRHLRYFVAVATELHFSTAARKLNISQPPLSKQIKQLEEELKVELLERTNRDVKLTEAGTYFFEVAKQTLKTLEREVKTVREIHNGETGSLTIGFGGSAVHDLLPMIIKQIHSRYPDLQLNVRHLTTDEQVYSLLNGTIDVGLLVPPIDNKRINLMPVREETLVVCLPKCHPLANEKRKIDVSEFADENIIMTPKSAGIGYYNSIISLCQKGGFFPRCAQTAQDQQTLVSLVGSELGIAFVSESTQKIIQDNVRYVQLKQKQQKITAIAWYNGYLSPELKLFLELMGAPLSDVFTT